MLPRRIQAAAPAAPAAPGPPAACSNERILQLVFKNKLSQTLFTGSKVEAEDGTPIQVQLLDAKTRELVSSGPEATARLEIVALDGDFAAAATSSSETAADEEGKLKTSYWEQSEFEHYTLKEREGKRPLLTGDLFVCLKEGEASLGEFQFTDNSSWIRSRKFCLGIKAALGHRQGIRIREAKTDRFIVKDHRGECKCVRLCFFTGVCLFVCFFLSSFFLSLTENKFSHNLDKGAPWTPCGKGKQFRSQPGQGCSMGSSLQETKEEDLVVNMRF
jgi:hypothetical protein